MAFLCNLQMFLQEIYQKLQKILFFRVFRGQKHEKQGVLSFFHTQTISFLFYQHTTTLSVLLYQNSGICRYSFHTTGKTKSLGCGGFD